MSNLHIQAQGQNWGDLFLSHKSGKQEGKNGKRQKRVTWVTATAQRKRCALSNEDNSNRVSRKGERNPWWLSSPQSSEFYKSRVLSSGKTWISAFGSSFKSQSQLFHISEPDKSLWTFSARSLLHRPQRAAVIIQTAHGLRNTHNWNHLKQVPNLNLNWMNGEGF